MNAAVILATGGAMVKNAYSGGKPAFKWVGQCAGVDRYLGDRKTPSPR